MSQVPQHRIRGLAAEPRRAPSCLPPCARMMIRVGPFIMDAQLPEPRAESRKLLLFAGYLVRGAGSWRLEGTEAAFQTFAPHSGETKPVVRNYDPKNKICLTVFSFIAQTSLVG